MSHSHSWVVDDAALRANRVAHDELLAAVGGLNAIAAVVLETDGGFSVIPRAQVASGSALP